MNIEASEIREAVEIIKTAILQGQYEASKDVNRIQLTIYFSIGKYISNHTRKGGWGTNILESISEHLHKELPGLRGYSATNLRNMRLFYESWQMLDSNSSVMTDENSKNTNTKTKYIDNQQRLMSITLYISQPPRISPLMIFSVYLLPITLKSINSMIFPPATTISGAQQKNYNIPQNSDQ